MPAGLDPETTARLIARHGSLSAAAEKAQRDPRLEPAFRELIHTQGRMGRHAAEAEFWHLVVAGEYLAETSAEASGVFVSWTRAEKALHLHIHDGYGRRRLELAVPGLSEWTARQLLSWYRVGKPDGLWLDDDDRVQVGAKLAPTSNGVWLPRI